MNPKRVLVTGASSALGKAVGRKLRTEGHHSTGTVRRIHAFESLPEFDTLLELDLNDPGSFSHIKTDFDALIHVAAASYGSPDLLMSVTGLATQHLAETAIVRGIPRFIHVSSTSVYGSIDDNELSSMSRITHQSPYGLAKWAAECFLNQLNDELSSVSVRSPAIVGAQKNPHFLQKTRTLMEEGCPVITASNPDFFFNNVIHEETLAEFLVHLAVTYTDGFRAFPVGSLQDVDLSELLSFMSRATGYEGQIVWSKDSDRPFSINLDDAIKLGLEPLTALETIRRWTHDWH